MSQPVKRQLQEASQYGYRHPAFVMTQFGLRKRGDMRAWLRRRGKEWRDFEDKALIAITHVRLNELMRRTAVKVLGEQELSVFIRPTPSISDDGDILSICINPSDLKRGEP